MYRSHVLVCGGTGCTSSNSLAIIEALEAEIAKKGLQDEVKVVRTGCFGLCALGPIMIVYPEGSFYSQVKVTDVPEIVEEHLLKGRLVKRLLYDETVTMDDVKSLQETDFYKKQHRVALRNCGVIDPENIEEYIGTGGYEALGIVLTEKTPQDVIQILLDSGLRVALALAAIGVIFVVFLTVLMANRFLTRFVVRKIEEPLDLLSEGARRLGEGDLDFRIAYAGKDEFAPVCGAFNEMAARLKESVERTRRDEESRKELLAGISHDLRSPLTSIRAYVEGLLDGVAQTEESKQRYLRTIRTKAEDIDRLVSQLFLYSKLDLEGDPMEMRPIRLDEFVAGFVEEAALDSRTRGLEITAEQLTPVTVSADPEQLRRVLSNILENSIKYKAKETGRLRITLEESGRLTLADDGPGVPEEALPKLFDVFYRSDPARKNPAGGSGLGLAIAAKAVQGMGGTIRARSGPHGGLAIEITLSKEEACNAENPDR